jgi:hypothetical protein
VPFSYFATIAWAFVFTSDPAAAVVVLDDVVPAAVELLELLLLLLPQPAAATATTNANSATIRNPFEGFTEWSSPLLRRVYEARDWRTSPINAQLPILAGRG